MTLLEKMTSEIVDTCLPGVLINDDDRALIAEHRDLLLGVEDELMSAFFGTVMSNPQAAEIVRTAGRDRIDAIIRRWWQETVTGDLDEAYLRGLALGGIVHVRHGVNNIMTLWGLQCFRDVVSAQVIPQVSTEAAIGLAVALTHLETTVASVIAEANARAHLAALERASGLRTELVGRMVAIEVGEMVSAARAAGMGGRE